MVILAVIFDLRSRRIPNALTLSFLILGVLSAGITGGLHGLTQSLLGILTASVTLGVFCYFGGMGMGDLKLCAAVGAWIGPSQLASALLITGLAGGVMAVAWAVAGGFFWQTLRGTGRLLFCFTGIRRRGAGTQNGALRDLTLANPLTHKMPYAPAIAI